MEHPLEVGDGNVESPSSRLRGKFCPGGMWWERACWQVPRKGSVHTAASGDLEETLTHFSPFSALRPPGGHP